MRLPFRPARTVVDPAGDYWGLYVTRTVPAGSRADGAAPLVDDTMIGSGIGGEGALAELPLIVIDFVWSSLLLPLLRALARTPGAFLKGRRSKMAWIQAVTLYGPRRTHTWTTTSDQVMSLVDAIATGLEQGKVTQPEGAVYTGELDD